MPRILKFSQKLVLTQYTFDSEYLSVNGTFSTTVIYGGIILFG